MAVKVIKATRQTPGIASGVPGNTEKIKVAAYCRVSTDSEEQGTSYEAQCRHYTAFITSNPLWKLAGIYADEGISGTSTKHREKFNKMIADCEKGLIDMVITKSISRWARNTIDSLQNIRKLKDLGIPVLFEKENINTMDSKGEVLITIMSSIAQQESESISKNVRMGIQYQFQQGKGRLNTAQFLGLEKSKDGKTLVIIPEEASLVRRIYREYLEGCSPYMIASRLTAEEIPTPTGKQIWYQSTIVSILENEKYCGDLLMQKYFTADFLTHKIIRNTGQLPQYYVENAHEPIIPKEIFYQVQGEMQRRSLLKYDPGKLRFGSSKALSGRLICGQCGRTLKRCTNPNPQLTDWRCRKRAYMKKSTTKESESKCPCRNVPEQEAKAAIIEAFNQLPNAKDKLLRMQSTLWDGAIKRIDRKLEGLKKQQEEITRRMDNICEEDQEEANILKKEIDRIRYEQTRLLLERAEAANREVHIRLLLELIDDMQDRIKEMETYDSPACRDYEEFFRRTRQRIGEDIVSKEGKVIQFSDAMVIRYLEKMTISEDAYEIEFKCGLTIQVPVT